GSLTYNLRVGTTPGGCDVVSPMADLTTGYRHVVDHGNVQRNTWWVLDAPPGTYSWSVQAIDGMYAGGPWATEHVTTAVAGVEPPPLAGLSLERGPRTASGLGASFNVYIPEDGHARLQLYDVGGRRVASLLDASVARGAYSYSWEPSGEAGGSHRGVFFARLELRNEV